MKGRRGVELPRCEALHRRGAGCLCSRCLYRAFREVTAHLEHRKPSRHLASQSPLRCTCAYAKRQSTWTRPPPPPPPPPVTTFGANAKPHELRGKFLATRGRQCRKYARANPSSMRSLAGDSRIRRAASLHRTHFHEQLDRKPEWQPELQEVVLVHEWQDLRGVISRVTTWSARMGTQL